MLDQTLKILVVEDEVITAENIKIVLENYGFNVLPMVTTGEEAVEITKEANPDLILMDIMLEGRLNGIEASQKIRFFSQIPIIFLTAFSDKQMLDQARVVDPYSYLIKPFNESDLTFTVEMAIYKYKAKVQLKNEKDINEKLAQLSQELLKLPNIEKISDMVLAQANNLTHSQFGFVGYIDPKTGYMICPTMTKEIWEKCQVPDKSIIFKKFGGLWGWVLKNRKTLLTNTPETDPRAAGTPKGHIPIERFIGVPAIIGDVLVGMIAVANKKSKYNDKDLSVIQQLGTIYALAIQQTQARNELEDYQEHLEELVEKRTKELQVSNERLRDEISERKNAEDKLKNQNILLKNVMDSLTHPFFVVNINDRTIAMVNEAAAREGLNMGDKCSLHSHTHTERCKSCQSDCCIEIIKKTLKPHIKEHIHNDGAGNSRFVEVHCYPMFDNDGKLIQMIQYTLDVTDRKNAEQQLKESRAEYKNLFDNIPIGIFKTTPSGKVLMANPTFIKMLGIESTKELSKINLNEEKYFLNFSRKDFLKKMEGKDEIKGIENRWRINNGREIYIRESVRKVWDEKRENLYYEGTIEDISEQKEIEMEKLRLLNILELSLNEIYIFDAKTLNFEYVNSSALKNLNYALEEMDRLILLDICPEYDKSSFFRLILPLRRQKKEKLIFTTVFQRKNGTTYNVEVSLQLIKYRSKMVFLAIVLDITEQKQVEEKARIQEQQLIQADKMVALGTLVSGVAHEVNNPNNFIMMNTPLLRDLWQGIIPILEKYHKDNGNFFVHGLGYTELNDTVLQLFDGVLEGAKRIKSIVKELKDFSRLESNEIKENIDINTVVKSAVTLTSSMIKKATNHFKIEYGEDIPTFSGSFQRLEQVIINLLQNACQALKDKEKMISISTRYNVRNHQITIIIKDQGEGIQPHHLKVIKNPFFTTKRSKGGTGLGLSISSNIIDAHGGTIEFESKVNEGTTVTIDLPINQ